MAMQAFHTFGTSAVDALVKRFMESKGIDPVGMIGYRLTRSIDDRGTIEFSMYFEDIDAPPAEQPKTAMNSDTGLKLVGERGPEISWIRRG